MYKKFKKYIILKFYNLRKFKKWQAQLVIKNQLQEKKAKYNKEKNQDLDLHQKPKKAEAEVKARVNQNKAKKNLKLNQLLKLQLKKYIIFLK
jgi:hypothetical protein